MNCRIIRISSIACFIARFFPVSLRFFHFCLSLIFPLIFLYRCSPTQAILFFSSVQSLEILVIPLVSLFLIVTKEHK